MKDFIMNKDYILHKWLNNSASETELEELKNSPEYADYIKIAEASSTLRVPNVESETNYDVISTHLNSRNKVIKLNLVRTFLKIAAVLAVVVAGYLYIDSLGTSIQTKVSEKHTFLLPDNSEVALNSNSSIEYNENSWNDQRELTLNGEAYFNVTKGSSFSVKTPSGIVTVLGTQFNVYSRGDKFLVNCYEGLVSVAYNDTLITLPAGTQLNLENGLMKNHSKINRTSPNWIASESSFDDATLQDVLKELEIQYPITITTEVSNVNNRFTGSFTHKNLNLALKSICDPLKLTYTIREESVTIYAKEAQ